MSNDTPITGTDLGTMARELLTAMNRATAEQLRPVQVLPVHHRELANPPAIEQRLPDFDTTDGPIREPGDDQPTWRDIYDPHELAAALDLHSARAFKRGDTQTSAELAFASQAIADLDAQITAERAESRKTTQRLLDTISELQFRSTHRVSGTDPGNGDTLYEPRGDEEGDER